MSKHLELFTDGGAIKIGNDYYGSCSYVIRYGKKYFTSTDPVMKGTNNFYELKGIRDGLRAIVSNWKELHNTEIWIISDSQYSISCLTEWFNGWTERLGKYYNKSGKEVSNIELILEIRDLLNLIPNHKFLKIRSHIDHNIEKTFEEFKIKNNINITFTDYLLMVRYNEACDTRITKAFNLKRRELADKNGVELI